MLIAWMILAFQTSEPSLSSLDKLAQARDVEGLTKFLASSTTNGIQPFKILKTNGAYDVGRFGWHAFELKGVGGEQFVVFSTPLTSEDTGELLFQRNHDKLKFIPESEGFGVKLVRHAFDLKFDLQAKNASIVDRLKLENSSGQADPFIFRMSPQYVVDSITNTSGKLVPFQEAGGVVSSWKPVKSDTYEIHYHAKVDLPNYAGSISLTEATLTNDYWYPMVARQPVPYDLTIHTPANWIAIGQGDLVSDKPATSERVFQYRMDLPCVYYSVSAGPFKKYSQEINGKWYSCWSSHLTVDQMEAQTELYAPVIEFYERFAPFPFGGYGAIDSDVYGGGALEAYSFTTWGRGSLPDEDAHEPSHTWWGGIVNNSYLNSFWNESFAVFSEGLYRRNTSIGNQKERQLAFIRDGNGNDSYNAASLAVSGADIGGVASSLGYGKGSQVLQMLEQIIGTDQMLRCMQEWIQRFQGKLSDWADFEAVVEKLNPNKDLKPFFDDWVRKPGYAELRVEDLAFSQGIVSMQLNFAGDSFSIPLEVMAQYADGTREFKMVPIAKSGLVTVPFDRKPSIISLDPWRRLLRHIDENETPVELNSLLHSYPRFTDPAHKDYLASLEGKESPSSASTDPAGKFLVGHPDSMPMLRGLCEKAGFQVNGNKLTYDGTTIDLNKGCALAVVDLGSGKQCVIGLGKTRIAPNVGRARTALTDSLGRFLRGRTEPKTSGNLTFKF